MLKSYILLYRIPIAVITFYILYRLSKSMGRLATERNRNSLMWVIAVGVVCVLAFSVMGITSGLIYGLGVRFRGWPRQKPLFYEILFYTASNMLAILSAVILRFTLYHLPAIKEPMPPPTPPRFD